jgi:hypothetical protein
MPTMTRSLERQEMYVNIITTAVEGGIGHWASVQDYHWYYPGLDGGTAEHEAGVPNAYVTLSEDEPSDDDNPGPFEITVEKIAPHWQKILKDKLLPEHILSRFRAFDREPEEADLDADDCDAVVQIACFGEYVYG